MSLQENEAILTICLMAAFADGSKSEEERSNFKSIMDSLGGEVSPNIFQNVLLKKITLEDVAARLQTSESKTLAYEMAVYICDSDDIINQKEKEFLDRLKKLLNIESTTAETIEKQGEEVAVIPVKENFEIPSAPNFDAEINKMILNYSILNGALELLPQSLATMAIIPLQTKMVYRIGKYYNYDLDSGHIKEFITTIGLGFTSQVLEGYARKLIGGFAKKFVGKMGKGIASAATGAAFSFGSTYAIGKVTHNYYSSGRKLHTDQLRNLFTKFSDESKSLYTKYQGEIQNKARNINVSEILPMIKENRLF